MSTAQGITYRPASPGDVKLLTRMLWVAFNWRDEAVSEQHWPDPTAAAKYVDGFGRHGDAGVVAAVAGQGVGAAWYRLLPADDPGYGFVAADIPEVTLGVASKARGRGIGTALMQRLLDIALQARFGRGGLLQGGISTGRTSTRWPVVVRSRMALSSPRLEYFTTSLKKKRSSCASGSG
mgnify:CR=1 FL=1